MNLVLGVDLIAVLIIDKIMKIRCVSLIQLTVDLLLTNIFEQFLFHRILREFKDRTKFTVGTFVPKLLYYNKIATMKRVFGLLIVCVLISCQEEEFTVIEEQETNEDAGLALQLRDLIQNVTSHDGTFDDMVDGSSCFSINFPYTVLHDGEPFQINSVADLVPFNNNDNLIPVYPIDITYADYISTTIEDHEEFVTEVNRCASGVLYDERVTCLDLVYPIRLAIYDSSQGDFETLILDHDKQTFQWLDDYPADVLVSMNYPMEVIWETGTTQLVEDDAALERVILDAKDICN